ncbi:hypothetical protein ACFLS1_04100 [Verrucomicrobiota bacterium]
MKRVRLTTVVICLSAVVIAANTANAEIEVFNGPVMAPVSAISVPAPDGGGDHDDHNVDHDTQDIIEFMNKDKLHGALISVDPEDYGLKWKHNNVNNLIDFSLPCISKLTLAKRKGSKTRLAGSVIRLTNGDMFNGKIISLDDSKLVLDTWYSGKIEIKRVMLKSMRPNVKSSSVIYEGPSDIKNWTFRTYNNQPSWRFKNGVLYSQQSYPIGRNVNNMPDVANIEFEVAWRSYPQFYFGFYTDNLTSYSGNNYSLRVSSSSVYLYRYSRNGGSRSIANMNIQEFSNNTRKKSKFNILVDKKKKSFTILIDGQMVKQCVDSNPFAGLGNGIMIQPQSQGDLKVSNIKITEWDGEIPKMSQEGSEVDEDLVLFANNDKVSGHLISISDGEAKLKTSYATMTVPIERMEKIKMSAKNAERARRNKNDIRAYFSEDGSITMQLIKLDKNNIIGRSENFGDITVPLHAFNELKLNIYTEKESGGDDGLW